MSENEASIRNPNVLSTAQVAEKLGISYTTAYRLIKNNRIPGGTLVGHSYMVPAEALEQYKARTAGRTRKQPPRWRVYQGGSYLLLTDILVETFPGKEATFKKKLEALNAEGSHLLTGTIHRFISQDEESPSIVHIWLVWKTNEMPDDAQQEQEFKAFQAEFAGILDWENARESLFKGLLYT